ncbi:MAG: FHA domain-containing protein [Coleofasciculaceae cyanobacterium]
MPAQSEHNHLLIVEDDNGRKEFSLTESVYSIGRDPNSDIRLISQFVSRRHATLVLAKRKDGSQYYRIVDGNLKGKNSSNGLLINGHKLHSSESHDLHDLDEIVFGPNVTAKYYLLKRDAITTGSGEDEFDITLISPNMMIEQEESS